MRFVSSSVHLECPNAATRRQTSHPTIYVGAKCVFGHHLRLPRRSTDHSVNSRSSVVPKIDHCREDARRMTSDADMSFHPKAGHIRRGEMACRHSLPLRIHGFPRISGTTASCSPRSSARNIQGIHGIPRRSRRGTDEESMICHSIMDKCQLPRRSQADPTQPTRTSAPLFRFVALLDRAPPTHNLVVRSEAWTTAVAMRHFLDWLYA